MTRGGSFGFQCHVREANTSHRETIHHIATRYITRPSVAPPLRKWEKICKQIGTACRDGGIVKKLNFMQKTIPQSLRDSSLYTREPSCLCKSLIVIFHIRFVSSLKDREHGILCPFCRRGELCSPAFKRHKSLEADDRRSPLRGALCSRKFILKCQTIPPVSTECTHFSIVGTGVLDCPKTIDYNQSKIGIVFLILAILLQLTSFILGQSRTPVPTIEKCVHSVLTEYIAWHFKTGLREQGAPRRSARIARALRVSTAQSLRDFSAQDDTRGKFWFSMSRSQSEHITS